MNPVEELFQQFAASLHAGGNWSKEQRKVLQAAIQEHDLDERKRDILRSKLFDLAKARASELGVAMVMDWLEAATRLLDGSGHGRGDFSGSSAFFSPGTDCLNAIIQEIKGAVRSLDVCVFTISDNRISEVLIEKHLMGLNIRIVTDNEKHLDAGSDILHMHRAGLDIRVDHTEYHMHHKFMVADRERLLTGSYNWTRSAAEHNAENILITTEESVVKQYNAEFERMWSRTSPFEA